MQNCQDSSVLVCANMEILLFMLRNAKNIATTLRAKFPNFGVCL